MSRPKYGWMTREAGDTAALTYHGTGQQETLASEMVWSSAKEELSGTLPSTRATGILLVWKSTHRIFAILCDPRKRENLEMRVQTLSIRRKCSSELTLLVTVRNWPFTAS